MKKFLQVFTVGMALSTAFALAQTNPGTNGQMGQPGQPGTYQNGQPGQPGQAGQMPPDNNTGMNSTSSTSASTSQTPVDDQTLQRQIHEQFATNPDLQSVQVSVDKGDVSLTGSVPSKSAKKDAKKMAKAVPGVKKVKEDLTVAANAGTGSSPSVGNPSATSGSTTGVSGESPSQGSMSEQPPASTNPNNTPNATPSTPPNTPPQGSFMRTNFMPQSGSQASGSANQNAGSSNDQNPGAAANATTQNPSAEDNGRASDAGQSGSVASPAGQSGSASTTGANSESPDQVKKDIQTAFTNEPTLSSSSITVDATSDTITLSGSAPSEKDRDEARRIAQSFAGNRKVVDNVNVSGTSSSPEMNANPSSNANSTPNSTTGATPNATTTPGAGTTPNQNPEQPNAPQEQSNPPKK